MLAKIKALFQPEAATREDPQRRLQLAAAALLIELARADHRNDAREQQVIADVVRTTFQLDADTVAELVEDARRHADDATSLHQFTALINQQFDDEEKIELVRQMWRVACADGDIDRYEDHMIRKVAELIYVSHSQFIRTKLEVIDTQGTAG